MKGYYYFSDSAFPVLLWVKSGCKRSYIPLSNSSKICPFNRQTYLKTALGIIAQYKRSRREWAK